MMTTPYLVLFDADKIKDYVFATGRLKEIRGASEQVRKLTDPDPIKKLSGLGDWQQGSTSGLIYAGGGAGALLVASKEEADSVCTRLERTYRHATHSATLSAVSVPVEASKEAEAQETAARLLSHRKASKSTAEAIPGGGVIRFCDSDRRYPASDTADPDEGDRREQLLLSAASKNKREMSRAYRKRFQQTPFWQRFCSLLDEENVAAWEQAIQPSQDLNAIGEQAYPRGYVALMHADGDGMGTLIKKVVQQHHFAGYQQVSTGLTDAAVQAAAEALHTAYPDAPMVQQTPGSEQRFLPFEVITIGGDDVLLICTADKALDIACMLSKVFTREIRRVLADTFGITEGHDASASVGVVIAHANHPIVNLAERAGELLKSAKRGRAKSGRTDEGWIDFHIVSSPGLQTLREIRRDHYQRDDFDLTARPYSCSTLQDMLGYARDLVHHKNVSGSKRRQLYDACLHAANRTTATLAVLQAQVRMSQEQRSALLRILREMDVGTYYPFLDTLRHNRYTTPLPDLLELAEFVGKE